MLNPNIQILNNGVRKKHSKASEEYVEVRFTYDNEISFECYEWWIPVEYRRTGISIASTSEEELHEYLNIVYEQLNPANFDGWIIKQKTFWDNKKRADVTKGFYDKLVGFDWKCVTCDLPPNPNFARRIQDLKEFGYTLATDTNRYCKRCNANKTHIQLLPIERGGIAGSGYETWSPALRSRIIRVLGIIDVYEYKINPHALPDHKFSEIRWGGDTKGVNPDNMTDSEIKAKFQLLSNQRNQQKREVCRACYQTDKRGIIYGIPFFYHGTPEWDKSIPRTGKEAEQGCIGCAWYDVAEWRRQLIKLIDGE